MGDGDRSRPTGTVSFLFTDIEGSTPLWEQHPDAMRVALARHDAILRDAIAARGGFVFSTAGDAFSAAFHTPGDAVGAALGAQQALQAEPWPDDAQVKVRMGVHTGTVQERDGDYFGSAVNRAARLMGLAHGGQVLVSLAVEELVRDDLGEGVGLEGLGEHALKGLSRPETVFQLTGPELHDGFPALAAATRVPGNLPSPPTSFVGRVEEVKRLAAEIPAHRLLTLVGPGGVGKTRLSIEAAAAVTDEFSDGVWFVELAPVAAADAVVHAVASTLSVSPEAGSTLLESIVDTLAGRRVLVVVDNCEHVIDAAAEIVAAVNNGAPKATVLASSREALRVAGERVWDVAALDASVEAVELFCERAAAVDRGFDPSEEDIELIGRISERLDGMPLAIELAASRVRSMSLVQLADRLSDRFRLLRSSARGGLVERQATLRATVEWSYRLLGPDEQVLFDRLSIFAGSFDLEAAEAVCGFEPLDELDVFDLLGSLVDKSLVSIDRDSGRYRLLETLRQYGQEQLGVRGEVAGIGRAHVDHFVEVARRAQAWFEGTRCLDGLGAFEADWDNFRAAMDWAVAGGDGVAATALVDATSWYAHMALRREQGDWARRASEVSGAGAPVWGAVATWALVDGDTDAALELSERGLQVAPSRRHPDTVRCWMQIANAYGYLRRHDQALEALRGWREVAGDRLWHAAGATWAMGFVTAELDVEDAAVHIEEARRMVAPLANPSLDCCFGWAAGRVEYLAGRYDRAAAIQARVLELSEECGNRLHSGTAALSLAMCARKSGNSSPELWAAAVERLHAGQGWLYLWVIVEALALEWAAAGQFHEAAVVIGHIEDHGYRDNPAVAQRRREALARIEGVAPEEIARGAAMTRDEVVAFCLDRLRHSSTPA